jgi:hypothetical protein
MHPSGCQRTQTAAASPTVVGEPASEARQSQRLDAKIDRPTVTIQEFY